jgi:hypothetical protein
MIKKKFMFKRITKKEIVVKDALAEPWVPKNNYWVPNYYFLKCQIFEKLSINAEI